MVSSLFGIIEKASLNFTGLILISEEEKLEDLSVVMTRIRQSSTVQDNQESWIDVTENDNYHHAIGFSVGDNV